MTLPASGTLTIAQIQAEIDGVGTMPVTIPNADWRTLSGVPSGQLVIPNDFWGKSWNSVAFTDSSDEGSGTGVHAGLSFGAARSDRRIVATVHWREGSVHRTLTSATIGGVAATIHDQTGHTGGLTGLGAAVISAIVPTGTTGTISLVTSGATTATSVGVYRMTGFTLLDADANQTVGTAGTASVTMTTAAGGCAIAAYTGSTGTAGFAITLSGVTENYDRNNGVRVGGGVDTVTSAGSQVISGTQGAIADAGNCIVATTWQ